MMRVLIIFIWHRLFFTSATAIYLIMNNMDCMMDFCVFNLFLSPPPPPSCSFAALVFCLLCLHHTIAAAGGSIRNFRVWKILACVSCCGLQRPNRPEWQPVDLRPSNICHGMKRKLHFSNGGVTYTVETIEGFDTVILGPNCQHLSFRFFLVPASQPSANDSRTTFS